MAEPAFYAYAYPEPAGFADRPVRPKGARYHTALREFVLPYDVVRTAADPDAALLDFCQIHVRERRRSRPLGPRRPRAVMKSERQRMTAGEMYDPMDAELAAGRGLAGALPGAQRHAARRSRRSGEDILRRLLGRGRRDSWCSPPSSATTDSNVELGERVFFNFNCVMLDVCPVRIGTSRSSVPAVQILTSDAPPRCGTAPTARSSASPSRSAPMCGWAAGRSFCLECGSARGP